MLFSDGLLLYREHTQHVQHINGETHNVMCSTQCIYMERKMQYIILHIYTVWAVIFAGFNVCGFRGSAGIHEYFVHEYLNVTVNGHMHSSSQSMTSCVTKMVISRCLVAASCNFTGYELALPQEERTDARDRAQYMADRFSDSFHCNSERSSLLLLWAQPSLSPLKGIHTSL